MRSCRLLLAAVLLAGCGTGEKEAGNSADGGIAAPVAAPDPAPVKGAPARPAVNDSIPAAFLGLYDGSLEACARPSDERLNVSPWELRFHESIGTVRKVGAAGSDAIIVEADFQGEGESWRSVRELRLSDGGAALTISGDGTRLARVRCPD